MKLFIIFIGAALLSLVDCESKEAKLQIGVKKRVPPEECTRKTQNGDHLEMHYTVSCWVVSCL